MATYTLVPLPRIGITPENGMLIYTYAAGGTTLAATYQDSNGFATNTNPVEADGLGLFPAIYLPLGTSYKFICTHANGVTIWTQDGIASVPSSSPAVDITGTAGEPILALANVYLSDGSGGKTAGLWYNADSANAYSSVTPYVGFATLPISTGMSGVIRTGGSLGGFASLSVGIYYVGTAGVITSTPPANARVVGQADTTTSLILDGNPPNLSVDVGLCEGRLTLTTALPVTIADVTAATTFYWTPYRGNRISLYDGTRWFTRTYSEISLAVPATTSQMYGVFVYDNAGTLTLELTAWTTDTAPGAAATVLQDGVLVKSGAPTRRYLGNIRTTAVSGQTEDSKAKRYVYNFYNQVNRVLRVVSATNSYSYDTAAYRQMDAANVGTTIQLDIVVGQVGAMLNAFVLGYYADGGANVNLAVSIGEDSAVTALSGVMGQSSASTAGGIGAGSPLPVSATLVHYPAIGRHFYAALERGGGGTTTWYGDNGDATRWQAGISGSIWM